MRDLLRVTEVVAARAEARFAALRQEEADLRARIADLDRSQRARAATATAEDPALRAGADLRWEGWIAVRRRTLLSELARLLARIEAEREHLARAVGRREVTQDLARAAEIRLRAARAARRDLSG